MTRKIEAYEKYKAFYELCEKLFWLLPVAGVQFDKTAFDKDFEQLKRFGFGPFHTAEIGDIVNTLANTAEACVCCFESGELEAAVYALRQSFGNMVNDMKIALELYKAYVL